MYYGTDPDGVSYQKNFPKGYVFEVGAVLDFGRPVRFFPTAQRVVPHVLWPFRLWELQPLHPYEIDDPNPFTDCKIEVSDSWIVEKEADISSCFGDNGEEVVAALRIVEKGGEDMLNRLGMAYDFVFRDPWNEGGLERCAEATMDNLANELEFGRFGDFFGRWFLRWIPSLDALVYRNHLAPQLFNRLFRPFEDTYHCGWFPTSP